MIVVPISIGELIDKLSILEIKKVKISNADKLLSINNEYDLLKNFSSIYLQDDKIYNLYKELININSSLWEIEDRIRQLELENRFEGEFIYVARSVYKLNDKRFLLKNKINEITSSGIKEVKGYV